MRWIRVGAVGLFGLATACGRSDLNDYLEERFFPLDASEIDGPATDGSSDDGEGTLDATVPPADSGGHDARSDARSGGSGSSSGSSGSSSSGSSSSGSSGSSSSGSSSSGSSSSGGGSGGNPEAGPGCDETTCTGCCVEEICAQGTQSIACGKGGGPCAVCSSSQSCTGGICQ